MSHVEKERLMSLRAESEPERLDRIAREAGFISYTDYEAQMQQLAEMAKSRAQAGVGEATSEAQPTFWTELF